MISGDHKFSSYGWVFSDNSTLVVSSPIKSEPYMLTAISADGKFISNVQISPENGVASFDGSSWLEGTSGCAVIIGESNTPIRLSTKISSSKNSALYLRNLTTLSQSAGFSLPFSYFDRVSSFVVITNVDNIHAEFRSKAYGLLRGEVSFSLQPYQTLILDSTKLYESTQTQSAIEGYLRLSSRGGRVILGIA